MLGTAPAIHTHLSAFDDPALSPHSTDDEGAAWGGNVSCQVTNRWRHWTSGHICRLCSPWLDPCHRSAVGMLRPGLQAPLARLPGGFSVSRDQKAQGWCETQIPRECRGLHPPSLCEYVPLLQGQWYPGHTVALVTEGRPLSVAGCPSPRLSELLERWRPCPRSPFCFPPSQPFPPGCGR